MGDPAKVIDDHGRCCGRKPLVYKRPNHRLFCTRCNAQFDPASGEQVSNWGYTREPDGTFTPKYPETETDHG